MNTILSQELLDGRTTIQKRIESIGPTSSSLELASEKKANARYDICKTCDLLIGGRCLHCGCEMLKRVHLESMQCPMTKWNEPVTSSSYLSTICNSNAPFDLSSLTDLERDDILYFAQMGLRQGGVFWYKNIELRSEKINGNILIYKNPDRRSQPDTWNEQDKLEFSQLSRNAKMAGESYFIFKGRKVFLTRSHIVNESSTILDRFTEEQRKEFEVQMELARQSGLIQFVYLDHTFMVRNYIQSSIMSINPPKDQLI